MKYIRTKDGRIYNFDNYANDGQGWYYHKITKDYYFYEKDILNQADTIEELCDEFVVTANYGIGYGAKPDIIEKENVSKFLNSYGEWSIYGAIWTDKGLIYVAKMNNKGELELL